MYERWGWRATPGAPDPLPGRRRGLLPAGAVTGGASGPSAARPVAFTGRGHRREIPSTGAGATARSSTRAGRRVRHGRRAVRRLPPPALPRVPAPRLGGVLRGVRRRRPDRRGRPPARGARPDAPGRPAHRPAAAGAAPDAGLAGPLRAAVGPADHARLRRLLGVPQRSSATRSTTCATTASTCGWRSRTTAATWTCSTPRASPASTSTPATTTEPAPGSIAAGSCSQATLRNGRSFGRREEHVQDLRPAGRVSAGLLIVIGGLALRRHGRHHRRAPSASPSSASRTGTATSWPSRPPGPRRSTEQEMPEYYAIVRELTAEGGHADAQALRHARPAAQRLRHRPQPRPRGRGRDAGHPAHPRLERAAGRARARDQPRRQPRHPHRLGRRRHRARASRSIANFLQFSAIFGGRDDDDGNPLALLAMAILAPIAAGLLQMALSRSREFEADRSGARLIGDGEPLARALQKLEVGARQIPMDIDPAHASAFIVNPLCGPQDELRQPVAHPPAPPRTGSPASAAATGAELSRSAAGEGCRWRPAPCAAGWWRAGRRRSGGPTRRWRANR